MANTHLSKRWFPVLEGLFGYRGCLRAYEIDFTRPWWRQYLPIAPAVAAMVGSEALFWGFMTYAPLLLARVFATRSYVALWQTVATFGVVWVCTHLALYWYSQAGARSKYSLYRASYAHFLLADPQTHTYRSTGQIINKISQGVNNSENFLDSIVFEASQFAWRLLAVTVTFLSLDIRLGLLAFGCLATISLIEIGMTYAATKVLIPAEIETDNELAGVAVESLQQVYLVRSTFATPDQLETLGTRITRAIEVMATVWFGFMAKGGLTRILYIASFALVIRTLLGLVTTGTLAEATALALGTTYLVNYGTVVRVGRQMERLLKARSYVVTLWELAREFADSTIPVLGEVETQPQTTVTYVAVHNLHFAYGQNRPVFAGCDLRLSVLQEESNKLYGIIGPSGTGKTTLINILGGQLRPTYGQILINGLDIYAVSDYTRRTLLGVQMQTATSLRGSLRANLLFGLPPKSSHSYDDEYLIQLVTKVGLWAQVFRDKQGLSTLIGEGGLSLSGGQRQRLNFASLYLRAKYYRPELLLIDEPTSSLDELSELAITGMIEELAATSVTWVVAHRLQTLRAARAILDTSLVTPGAALTFESPQRLQESSQYYRDLLENRRELDD